MHAPKGPRVPRQYEQVFEKLLYTKVPAAQRMVSRQCVWATAELAGSRDDGGRR